MTLANYQFLPWLRKGLGNTIPDEDKLGSTDGVTSGRAKLSLQVHINSRPAGKKDFLIVGPADVIGFSKDLVIRTEPVNWSTTFAPNLLAHIEFYEEDFPWRYSPAKAVASPNRTVDDRLRPWLSLIVLKEDEFKREKNGVPLPQVPLPQIALTAKAVLPDYHDTWLWAHVQEIKPSSLSSDETAADHIISRLICPRKLEANMGYYAFVIPTFESGRLAGLGKSEEEIKNVLLQKPAWDANSPQAQTIFPVYYEWFFRTAAEMDFEYLASLLEAKATDPLVGKKPVDCRKPGFGIPDYAKEFTLYLEGALRVPKSQGSVSISTESATNLEDFEKSIQKLLNLTNQGAGDPVVTPPFYGQKHIFEKTLSLTEQTWIHQLNRNPAYRAVSGLGAKVFRKYQDMYLQKAWEQLESIVEANKIIDAANATMAVCQLLYEKNIIMLPPEEMIAFAGPVHVKVDGKVGGKEITLFEAFRQSCFSGSAYSTGFRRLTSRRGAFRRKLERNGQPLDLVKLKYTLIERARKPFTLEDTENPEGPRKYSILLFDRPEVWTFQSSFGGRVLAISDQGMAAFEAFTAVVKNPTTPPKKPCCEEKILHFLEEAIKPSKTIPSLLLKTLNMPEAGWFKDPLNIKAALAYPDFEDPMVEKLKELSIEWLAPNLHLIPNNSVTLLEPNRKFIEAFMVGVNVAMNREMRWREYPTDERGSCFRQFWDVKGVKDINDTTANPARIVEKFKDISPIHTWKNWDTQKLDEFGVHNTRSRLREDEQLVLVIKGDLLKCFPNTTIYVAEAVDIPYAKSSTKVSIDTTKSFAEAGFANTPVGTVTINGQPFTLSDYSTVQAFMDAVNNDGTANANISYDEIEDTFYIELKSTGTDLVISETGTNPFFTQAKITPLTEDGKQLKKLRIKSNPQIKFPAFKAEAGADLKFIGFDLTIADAKGDATKPGWFFVLQETPGEARFGLDIKGPVSGTGLTWDDASWDLVTGGIISINETTSKEKVTDFENKLASTEKDTAKWGRSSADMAYILYQKPVMIAIHANEMLP